MCQLPLICTCQQKLSAAMLQRLVQATTYTGVAFTCKNFLQFLCLVQGTIEESKQEEEEPEVAVPKLDIPDLRQILKRRDEPRATGMFSAAEFIALDDDEAQPQESHEDSHDSAELNGVEDSDSHDRHTG